MSDHILEMKGLLFIKESLSFYLGFPRILTKICDHVYASFCCLYGEVCVVFVD